MIKTTIFNCLFGFKKDSAYLVVPYYGHIPPDDYWGRLNADAMFLVALYQEQDYSYIGFCYNQGIDAAVQHFKHQDLSLKLKELEKNIEAKEKYFDDILKNKLTEDDAKDILMLDGNEIEASLIKKRVREMQRNFHPDKNKGQGEIVSQLINAAADKLSK